MKAWHKLYLLSMVLALGFGATVVKASTGTQAIEVIYQDLKMYVRGLKITPQEEPFIFNGRTYVPLRAVAEALGEDVKYDGETKSIYIGKLPAGEVFLSELSPYHTEGGGNYYVDKYGPQQPFTMGGKQYTQKGVGFGVTLGSYLVEQTYNLNGKFKSLTGKFGLDDSYNHAPVTITFYGDDQKLAELTAEPGKLPTDFTVDLKSAAAMKIVVQYASKESTDGSRLNLVDAVLHP